jgi:hypothetical protein
MNKNEILMANARQIACSNPFERLAFSRRKITDEEILDFVRENLVIDKDDNGNVGIKEVLCSIDGHLFGDVKGDVRGNVIGDVWEDVKGSVLGDVRGDVLGDVRGDVCGDVRGNVVWDVYGKVLGKVHG